MLRLKRKHVPEGHSSTIIKIVKADRYVSPVSIVKELNVAQNTMWKQPNKVGYTKKKLIFECHSS